MTRHQYRVWGISSFIIMGLILFPPWIWGFSPFKDLSNINTSKLATDGWGIDYAFIFSPPHNPTLSVGVWDISEKIGDNPDGTWSVAVFYPLLALEIVIFALFALLVVIMLNWGKYYSKASPVGI